MCRICSGRAQTFKEISTKKKQKFVTNYASDIFELFGLIESSVIAWCINKDIYIGYKSIMDLMCKCTPSFV